MNTLEGTEQRLPPSARSQNFRWPLYTAHLLVTWSLRMDEFASALFTAAVFPDTLLPVSIFGIVVTLFGLFGGDRVGMALTQLGRFSGVSTALVLSTVCLSASAGIFLSLAVYTSMSSSVRYVLFGCIILLSGVARLSSMAYTISIERDWVVRLASCPTSLTALNTSMRRIDLICKVVAPLVASTITTTLSLPYAIIVIGGWTMISLPFEFKLLRKVFISEVALRSPQRTDREPTSHVNQPSSISKWQTLFYNWKIYYNQRTFLASFALSQLYLTVLSFGGPMITYLKWKGYSDLVVAVSRGIGVIVGLGATIAMPITVGKIGLERSGLWAIWSQVSFISLAVAAAWGIAGDVGIVNQSMLLGGVAASRFGLWMFDLVATQFIQEGVSEEHAVIVGGCQAAASNFFELISLILTAALPDPVFFQWPALASGVAVAIAAISYTRFSWQERGHLLHID
ncbi:Ferroporti-1 [Paraphysoderma sedebokerense]|nr:Ferroporti-1 [Paraphysoderma sedebokerense]KAI9138847.1 Ferroporti-1 [Paraphysoderma sedebokerense]